MQGDNDPEGKETVASTNNDNNSEVISSNNNEVTNETTMSENINATQERYVLAFFYLIIKTIEVTVSAIFILVKLSNRLMMLTTLMMRKEMLLVILYHKQNFHTFYKRMPLSFSVLFANCQ